ncbi:TPA: hypothetical protein ACJP84_001770 [Streptococcus pyogenes]
MFVNERFHYQPNQK